MSLASPTTSSTSWWHRPRSRDGQRRNSPQVQVDLSSTDKLSIPSPSASTASISSQHSSRFTAIVSAIGFSSRRPKSSRSLSSKHDFPVSPDESFASQNSFSSFTPSLAPSGGGRKLSRASKTLSTSSSEGPQTPITIPYDPFAGSPSYVLDFHTAPNADPAQSPTSPSVPSQKSVSRSKSSSSTVHFKHPPPIHSPISPVPSLPPNDVPTIQGDQHSRTYSDTLRAHLAQQRSGKLKLPSPKAPPVTEPPAIPTTGFPESILRKSGRPSTAGSIYESRMESLLRRGRATSDASVLLPTSFDKRQGPARQKSLHNLKLASAPPQTAPPTAPPPPTVSKSNVPQRKGSLVLRVPKSSGRTETGSGKQRAALESPISQTTICEVSEQPDSPSSFVSESWLSERPREQRSPVVEQSSYLLPPEKLLEMMEAPSSTPKPAQSGSTQSGSPPKDRALGVPKRSVKSLSGRCSRTSSVSSAGLRPRPRSKTTSSPSTWNDEMEKRLKGVGFDASIARRNSIARFEAEMKTPQPRTLRKSTSFLTLDDDEDQVAPKRGQNRTVVNADSFIDFGRSTSMDSDRDSFDDEFFA